LARERRLCAVWKREKISRVTMADAGAKIFCEKKMKQSTGQPVNLRLNGTANEIQNNI
jgi:hypothetical protein